MWWLGPIWRPTERLLLRLGLLLFQAHALVTLHIEHRQFCRPISLVGCVDVFQFSLCQGPSPLTFTICGVMGLITAGHAVRWPTCIDIVTARSQRASKRGRERDAAWCPICYRMSEAVICRCVAQM